MKILMLSNATMAVDNFTASLLKEGEEYEVTPTQGCRLMQQEKAKLSVNDPGEVSLTRMEIRE